MFSHTHTHRIQLWQTLLPCVAVLRVIVVAQDSKTVVSGGAGRKNFSTSACLPKEERPQQRSREALPQPAAVYTVLVSIKETQLHL